MAAQSTTKPASNFEPLDKLASSTLKRNPKMELSKTDLLKLLSYLEGELQAREIVIATLKAEKVKQLLYQTKHGSYNMDDPLAALQRDAFAACSPGFDEVSVRITYSNQLLALETLIDAQKCSHVQMKEQLEKTQEQYAKTVQDLEEEKRKHAQDTAQGDDVTYLLERERERLKQEVEFEKQQNKKIEKELRKVVAALEQERAKQKQIVLLLLAERKRIITRLLEERHRCEELQQVLQMEKGRMADMVDGLEEESQKSLQMEAELEQQLAQFDAERAQLQQTMTVESERCRLLQEENQRLQQETETLKQQLAKQSLNAMPDSSIQEGPGTRMVVPPGRPSGSTSPKPGIPPPTPAKPSSLHPPMPTKPVALTTNLSGFYLPSSPGIRIYLSGTQTNSVVPQKMMAKVHKASSPVPVQQTEIRRVVGSSSPIPPEGSTSPPPVISTITKTIQAVPVSSPGSPVMSRPVQGPVRSIAYAPTVAEAVSHDLITSPGQSPVASLEKSVPNLTPSGGERSASQIHVTPRVNVSAGPGTKVFTSTQGGKVTFHVTTMGSPQAAQVPPPQPPKKPLSIGRGTPPPIPPNKPILTPQSLQKKEAISRTLTPNTEPGQPVTYEVVKQPKFGAQGVKFGITVSKDKINIPNPEASSNDVVSSSSSSSSIATASTAAPDGPQVGGGAATIPILPPSSPPAITPSMDLLGQELADFQQLLVSMVAGGSSGLGPSNHHSVLPSSPLCSIAVNDKPPPLATADSHAKSSLLQENKDDSLNSSRGGNPNIQEVDGSTLIHTAAAEGNIRCLTLLLENGDDVNISDNVDRTPLYSAASHGHAECIQLLLENGAHLESQTQAGWTAIHAVIQSDHLDCLALLLSWGRNGFNNLAKCNSVSEQERSTMLAEYCGKSNDPAQTVFPTPDATTLPKKLFSKSNLCTLSELLALRDQDGWTPAHLAASKESMNYLELLLASCGTLDLNIKDKWGKTVYDVASTSCRNFLDSLNPNASLSCLYLHWFDSFEKVNKYQLIGITSVTKDTTWNQLENNATKALCNHFDILTEGIFNCRSKQNSKEKKNSLGLGADSISVFTIGNHNWIPGQSEFIHTPYDILSNNDISSIIIQLKGGRQGYVDDIAYSTLMPISILQNYMRLLEQYKGVVFYGPEGSGKSQLAYKLAYLLQVKQQKNGSKWKMVHFDLAVENTENLLDRLKSVGCLCPSSQSSNSSCIIILDHLTPVIATNHLATVLPLLDCRGKSHTANVTFSNGKTESCYIPENCFIFATMDKCRRLGLDLVTQQHCRWVHLRPDSEPCHLLLSQHLMRNLYSYRSTASGSLWTCLQWLHLIWQRINECLLKLGIVELMFGPFTFLPPKKDMKHSSQVFRFVTDLWNNVITLSVEQAMTDRIRPLSEQQVRLVDAALTSLLQKAVLRDCPIPLQERNTYLLSFRGCANTRLLSHKARFSWGSSSPVRDLSVSANKGQKRLSDPTEKLILKCNSLLKDTNLNAKEEAKEKQSVVSKSLALRKNLFPEKITSPIKSNSTDPPLKEGKNTVMQASGCSKRIKTETSNTTSGRSSRQPFIPHVKKVVSPVTPKSFSNLNNPSSKEKKKS